MASQLRMDKVTLMKTFGFGLYKELSLEKAGALSSHQIPRHCSGAILLSAFFRPVSRLQNL